MDGRMVIESEREHERGREREWQRIWHAHAHRWHAGMQIHLSARQRQRPKRAYKVYTRKQASERVHGPRASPVSSLVFGSWARPGRRVVVEVGVGVRREGRTNPAYLPTVDVDVGFDFLIFLLFYFWILTVTFVWWFVFLWPLAWLLAFFIPFSFVCFFFLLFLLRFFCFLGFVELAALVLVLRYLPAYLPTC
ncbi:uncharacterized protein K452DRAFT_56487 [Aplosporella prunicola CBS 121167]|uniref:Uncharacterized protein n=1 Tax=Aplosporella prunicola CBS 121167 TaxID=1176127 RepID=A0A6A6BA92_9PEZI|nr:uncharacterized protein K452DRAFT_56487 [Aplosporella prunicola CBS 121167]KAF2139827.1 hypothetical protein K452DRAFT_56487 [Aplosporella prunicola CBS 121167]